MPPPTSNPHLWPLDLETGMRVAPKVGNLPSKFGHAKPLGSRIIRYVRNGQTNGRTDGQKQRLLLPSYGRRHNNNIINTQQGSSILCVAAASHIPSPSTESRGTVLGAQWGSEQSPTRLHAFLRSSYFQTASYGNCFSGLWSMSERTNRTSKPHWPLLSTIRYNTQVWNRACSQKPDW